MLQLMSVPAGLEAAVRLGTAYVDGAMVKDATTNLILAHLQPTRLLSTTLTQGLNFVTAPLTLASELGQNWQLWKMQQLLDTLQTVASIGSAASVLNLGVSVGGFALVLQAIRKVDGKLDAALASLDALHQMHKGDHLADVRSILEAAEDSFKLPLQDQRDHWTHTEREARRYSNRTLQRLDALGLPLEPPGAAPATASPGIGRLLLQQAGSEAASLLAMLMHLTSVRSEALLCLQRPLEAAELAQRQAAWLACLPIDPNSTAQELIGQDVLPRRQLEHTIQQSNALTTWARHSAGAAQQRAQLCEALEQHGVDTLAYVRTVRDHPQATLLMLPHGEVQGHRLVHGV